MNTYSYYKIEIREAPRGEWLTYYDSGYNGDFWSSDSLQEANKKAKELSEFVQTASDGKKTYQEARVIKEVLLEEVVETFTSKKLLKELKRLGIKNG